jgi:hypothetical protein
LAGHADQLRRIFCLREVRNIADVPDNTHEVYLRMLRLPDVESMGSPKLFTVAKYVVRHDALKVRGARSSCYLGATAGIR